jgi:hypothetical protein
MNIPFVGRAGLMDATSNCGEGPGVCAAATRIVNNVPEIARITNRTPLRAKSSYL